jgi:hypothetical protein
MSDKHGDKGKAFRGPYESTWNTLYIQPDRAFMLVVQTYECGEIQHYVRSTPFTFTGPEVLIPGPWNFRRVVFVEGDRSGLPLVNSNIVIFASILSK